MPKITINVTKHDMKLIRRLARYERRGEMSVARSLFFMGMNIVRVEERAGWYYGPAPRLPHLPAEPSRFAGWSKEQRDAYVMNGTIPERAMIARSEVHNSSVSPVPVMPE